MLKISSNDLIILISMIYSFVIIQLTRRRNIKIEIELFGLIKLTIDSENAITQPREKNSFFSRFFLKKDNKKK